MLTPSRSICSLLFRWKNAGLSVNALAPRWQLAKARGQVFGNPRLAEINRTRQYNTRKKTIEVAPIVLPLRKKGMTLQQIATTLNEMGMKTSTGGIYYPTQIKRIVERETRHEGKDQVAVPAPSLAFVPNQTQRA